MTAHIFVLGFVQGVGFRRFLRSKALKLNLTGWVKNISDGRVEAMTTGEREKIEELVVLLKKGNLLSDTKSVQLEWQKIEEHFDGFELRFG